LRIDDPNAVSDSHSVTHWDASALSCVFVCGVFDRWIYDQQPVRGVRTCPTGVATLQAQ